MNKLAIIPARGGSKRIPKKNIRDFLGKPIIAYSIEAALESGLFKEVMVSTDNEEIAEIAISFGAKVPFMRSKENANDYATTVDVLLEVLHNYHDLNKRFEHGCCIYPTAPLLNPNYLEHALNVMIEGEFSTVFPIVEYEYPVLRSLEIDGNGKVSMLWPEHLHSRSQDLSKTYHDAGQFYWFNVEDLLEGKKLFGDQSGAIVLNTMQAHDIDTEEDWRLAELKVELRS